MLVSEDENINRNVNAKRKAVTTNNVLDTKVSEKNQTNEYNGNEINKQQTVPNNTDTINMESVKITETLEDIEKQENIIMTMNPGQALYTKVENRTKKIKQIHTGFWLMRIILKTLLIRSFLAVVIPTTICL